MHSIPSFSSYFHLSVSFPILVNQKRIVSTPPDPVRPEQLETHEQCVVKSKRFSQ